MSRLATPLAGITHLASYQARTFAELAAEWPRTGKLRADIRTELDQQPEHVRTPRAQE
ncbi:hypothetical protein O1Q96_25775 [Streptomyces sp. Qhu-G9]|uniref:hypothetical protein n=1 Tax=Streptomyces sp. Qhu-G9 TaxID=3452799 RepID=UPI0022AC7459|nr:hypothetical protein [Streptomyces aurantiacus]WAU82807.1 hypothetical protein O1Q96_25775 [Streptomyces aurantiacus]